MNKRIAVASVSTLIAGLYAVWRLASVNWDPVGIFELGTQYSQAETAGSEGYDGQFVYFIAIQPDPQAVASRLDAPAYRYQRILLPLLGRLVGLGIEAWIPWALIAVNLAAHWLGTWAVSELLANRGAQEWFALGYGLWVGLVAPVGIGLAEPLAYGLVALGLLAALDHKRTALGVAALGMAGFAKETTLIFLAALLAAELSGWQAGRGLAGHPAAEPTGGRARRVLARLLVPRPTGRRTRSVLTAGGVAVAAHVLWQLWLLDTFGAVGIGSGGALATQFEWIPFMGLLRIGGVNMAALALYVLVFGPPVVLPALWGVLRTVRDLFRGSRGVEVYALLGNGLAVMALPFSTFREPLGIVRFADGLVLAVLLYAANHRVRRPLRYSLLWPVWLALLISQ